MRLVIDANRIFAALIKDGYVRKLIFETDFIIYTPSFLFEELARHLEEISRKSGLPETHLMIELDEFICRANIIVVDREEINDFLYEAKLICPDVGDIPYFALALKLNCPIWSEDRLLKRQSRVIVLSTKELIEEMKKNREKSFPK